MTELEDNIRNKYFQGKKEEFHSPNHYIQSTARTHKYGHIYTRLVIHLSRHLIQLFIRCMEIVLVSQICENHNFKNVLTVSPFLSLSLSFLFYRSNEIPLTELKKEACGGRQGRVFIIHVATPRFTSSV